MKDASDFIKRVLLNKHVQIAAGKAWPNGLFRRVSEREIMELPEYFRHDFVLSILTTIGGCDHDREHH